MRRRRTHFGSRRGTAMVESALVLLVFAVLIAGIMELGLIGFASNSVGFAAQRAARYAAVRGSGSGHPASTSDIQSVAQGYAAPLNSNSLTVTVTWTPNNNPGSTVRVQVAYSLKPSVLPISSKALTLQGTASQIVTQ